MKSENVGGEIIVNPAEVVMNPVRQRIMQFLMVHEKGTVKEMKNQLKDIPTPSLYRHIKILVDHSIIVGGERLSVKSQGYRCGR